METLAGFSLIFRLRNSSMGYCHVLTSFWLALMLQIGRNSSEG